MVKKFNESTIDVPIADFAFSILDKVSQGSYTKWSIVYDISNKKIHFKTADNTSIKTIDFAAFNFVCGQPAKMFNMNQDMKGEVSRNFTLPDKRIKRQVMDQAVTESSSRVGITTKEKEELLVFEDGISCSK